MAFRTPFSAGAAAAARSGVRTGLPGGGGGAFFAPSACFFAFVESLDVLEAAMGRPLPPDIRAALQADADAYPIDEDRLASWTEWDGYEITRQTPEGEWVETFAPPGHPNPFARRWWAEVDLYIRGEL